MNWLTHLFSNDAEKQSTQKTSRKATDQKEIFTPVKAKPTQISDKKISLTVLKNLIPLRELDDYHLAGLNQSVHYYKNNDILFIKGDPSQSVYYLLQGCIQMQPDCDNSYQLTADSEQAKFPLNSGKQMGATATAESEVILLLIDIKLNQFWGQASSSEEIACVELMDIVLPEPINDSRFFNSFTQAYKTNTLSLPSLPHVALKLKEAMQMAIGVNEAVEIIQIDPPLVTKLIQIANSAMYSPVTPITNCHDAVTRLGLNATRNFVLSIGLKQLFRCQNEQLMQGMQTLWKNSLYISSLSFILAQETGATNPEDALLAGLICDIGAIPLLHFAEQHSDESPELRELEEAMPFLRAPVGTLVLHTLGFPDELCLIPQQAENWHYESGDKLDLIDIIILAKLHSYVGTKRAKDLPYINSIPAYAKLKNGKLTPDFSLQLLQKAQKRIDAAISILS